MTPTRREYQRRPRRLARLEAHPYAKQPSPTPGEVVTANGGRRYGPKLDVPPFHPDVSQVSTISEIPLAALSNNAARKQCCRLGYYRSYGSYVKLGNQLGAASAAHYQPQTLAAIISTILKKNAKPINRFSTSSSPHLAIALKACSLVAPLPIEDLGVLPNHMFTIFNLINHEIFMLVRDGDGNDDTAEQYSIPPPGPFWGCVPDSALQDEKANQMRAAVVLPQDQDTGVQDVARGFEKIFTEDRSLPETEKETHSIEERGNRGSQGSVHGANGDSEMMGYEGAGEPLLHVASSSRTEAGDRGAAVFFDEEEVWISSMH